MTPRRHIYGEIITYLQRHPGERFTASQLAVLLHVDRAPIQAALNRSAKMNLLGSAEQLHRGSDRYDPQWWWQSVEAAPPAVQPSLPFYPAEDWSDRHAASRHIIQFFTFEHLRQGSLMRSTSQLCSLFADSMLGTLPDGPELSAGMRKLLEAKDCFVRAALLVKEDE